MKHRIPVFFGVVLALVAGVAPLQAQISTNNLLAWFNADAGVTVDSGGSNVVRWADQSANGNDATQTALDPVHQPTRVTSALHGHSILRFGPYPTEADYLSLTNNTLDLTSGLSIFIVAKNAVRKDYNGLFRIGPAGSPFNASSDLELFWNQSGSTVNSGYAEYVSNRGTGSVGQQELGPGATPPVGSYYIYDVIATPSTAQMRINTTNAPTVFGTPFAPLAVNWAAIGVGYGGGLQSLNGDIAEIVIYNTNLSASQRDNVWAYLEGKYALGIPEPSTMVLLGLVAVVFWRRR